MPAIRHMKRSSFDSLRSLRARLCPLALAVMFAVPGLASAGDDEQSVQTLFERGALQEAVERAGSERGNPESIYLAAQALMKMDNTGGAEERYSRLREAGDESWQAIGESGEKLLAGDLDGAMQAARRAVDANGDNPYAHYQLGLVASKQNNHQRATQAFTRATELKPDFAYAHFYAGQSAQRLRQTSKMADHFQMFVRLAPDAPERQAVQAILRSLR